MTFLRFFCAAGCFLFSAVNAQTAFRLDENTKQLLVSDNGKAVFVYQYDLAEISGVSKNDLRRFAGCYIHPLYGINGEVLTDNAPKDHFHHHGVFWTYPHVEIQNTDGTKTEYDLWQGNKNPLLRQWFVRWVSKSETADSFTAENGWFITNVFDGKPTQGEKIIQEFVTVTVHPVRGDTLKSRSIDIELRWIPVKPVSLRGAEGKSYGGLTVRLNPYKAEKQRDAVHSEVNVITVPSGVAKSDLPDTPLPWCDYTSRFDGNPQRSGLAIFVPKDHPGYPPTWLIRYYGPLCVGYPGVKAETYQPGEELKLRYRLWIHHQPVSKEQLEKEYQSYNNTP